MDVSPKFLDLGDGTCDDQFYLLRQDDGNVTWPVMRKDHKQMLCRLCAREGPHPWLASRLMRGTTPLALGLHPVGRLARRGKAKRVVRGSQSCRQRDVSIQRTGRNLKDARLVFISRSRT